MGVYISCLSYVLAVEMEMRRGLGPLTFCAMIVLQHLDVGIVGEAVLTD
jgi:hypothetical protein